MKWNESGFRPPLSTYRLNWARRTSWGWWDDWDDTVLQTQDSKFEPWRSEAEHATSRSRRLPTILTFTRGWGRNICVSFKPPRLGTEPRTLAWKAAVLTTTLYLNVHTTQRPLDNYPMQVQCRSTVNYAGTTLSQHWFIAMCLLCILRSCQSCICSTQKYWYNADSFVAYVPDINTMLGWFFVAHATDAMYVNSTLVYRCPVWQDMKTEKNNLYLNQYSTSSMS